MDLFSFAAEGRYSLAQGRSRRDKKGSKANARADLLAKIKNARETGEKFVPEVCIRICPVVANICLMRR